MPNEDDVFELDPQLSQFRLPSTAVEGKRIVSVHVNEALEKPVVVGERFEFVIDNHTYTIRPMLSDKVTELDLQNSFSLTGSIGLPDCTRRLYFRVFAAILNLFRDKKFHGIEDPGSFTLTELVRQVKWYMYAQEDEPRVRDVDLRRLVNRIAWSMNFSLCNCIVYTREGKEIKHNSSLISLTSTEAEDVTGAKEVTFHLLGVNPGMLDPDQLLWITDTSSTAARRISFDGTIEKKVAALNWSQYINEQIGGAATYGMPVLKDSLPEEIRAKLGEDRIATTVSLKYNDLYSLAGADTKMQRLRFRDDLYATLSALSEVIGWRETKNGRALSNIVIYVYAN